MISQPLLLAISPRILITALLASAAMCVRGELRAQARRVACIGDSITFGARIPDREHNAYPAQLAARLGPSHEVRNFGVGGATLIRDGDRPYTKTKAFADALAWRPEVAIVQLGTNDTVEGKRGNWSKRSSLAASAEEIVDRLRKANVDVEVLLVAPSPIFAKKRGLSEARRKNLEERAPRLREIARVLKTVAFEKSVRFVTLDRVLRARDVTDGVHPTSFGAERYADFYAELLHTPSDTACNALAQIAALEIECKRSEFHGFRRLDFELGSKGEGESGRFKCTLVTPHTATYDRQWIWRARFFGHQPALDLALLDRGFHVLYCDVAGLYGAPDALARFDAAYAFACSLGLHPKPVLEGMSRGGLPVVNWAAKKPGRVSALYLDNPVCDFRSWPGGANGRRSDADWKRCLAAYGLDEGGAKSFAGMPIDVCAPLFRRRVPLFLVYGEKDIVVPPRENGLQLATLWRRAGAPCSVWRKPGDGHHPHGLRPVDPLLRHVLRSVGRSIQPAVLAAHSAEHRGKPAGWGGGTWHSAWQSLRKLVASRQESKLIFLGDSITQSLTGHGERAAKIDGARGFDRAFGVFGGLCLGLSGDRTEHILWRIENGQLDGLEPRLLVVTIGTNNINARQHTGAETAEGTAAIVRALRSRLPAARILLLGCFPLGRSAEDTRRDEVAVLHQRIRRLADSKIVHYLDLRSLFVDEDGEANDKLGRDGIHLTQEGKLAWIAAMLPTIEKLCADGAPEAGAERKHKRAPTP